MSINLLLMIITIIIIATREEEREIKGDENKSNTSNNIIWNTSNNSYSVEIKLKSNIIPSLLPSKQISVKLLT